MFTSMGNHVIVTQQNALKLEPLFVRISKFLLHCSCKHVYIMQRIFCLFLQMVELMGGSGVFWYSHQRVYCSVIQNWLGYVNAAVDIFFTKEKLSMSCAKGIEKKSKTGAGHEPLNPLIVQAIIGKCKPLLLFSLCSLSTPLSLILPTIDKQSSRASQLFPTNIKLLFDC